MGTAAVHEIDGGNKERPLIGAMAEVEQQDD
jgi:hypothetical protein